ncbi:hypothetical protein CTEN210_06182 [Chaetoceros tenuissimus]|uniref:RING-type E3 ubiquitin transferase n=1 Tax=Chaetoceros tenuissimus TaxID=426638 RepID=A0AAD3CPE3_9STRA|nr:hypothetical protein CTEN210_06182 [Chaetoceros tenuissimus]
MSSGKGECKVSPSRLRSLVMKRCDGTISFCSNVKQQQIKEIDRNSMNHHCKSANKQNITCKHLTDDSDVDTISRDVSDFILDCKSSAIESRKVPSIMHVLSHRPSSDCKVSAKHDFIEANGRFNSCDNNDDDSVDLNDPDLNCKPSAEEWDQVMSGLDQDHVARKKAETDLLHMHQQIKVKREQEDYILCKTLQEEECHKTADPIQEQKEMINSTSGKAVVVVQRIIQLVNDAKKEFPLSAHQFDSVATDDMVYMAERILDKQQEFLKKGIPSYIDVGYHYTHPDNMRKIRSNGLLTQAERDAKSINSRKQGSFFGDGIYTANYPTSFARYGEQGLLVARLIGKSVRVPKPLSCLTSSNCLDIASSSNTIVGDKSTSLSSGWPGTDQHHEIVLKTSSQCLPMVRYDRRLVGNRELKTDHRGLMTYVFTSSDPNRIVETFKSKLQRVLDGLINEGSLPEPYGQLLENNSSFSLQWNSLSNGPSTTVISNGKGTKIVPFLPTSATVIGTSVARLPAGYLTKNSLSSGVPPSGGTRSTQQKSSSSGGFSFGGAFTTQQKSYTSAHHNGTTYGRSLGGPYPSSSAFGQKRSSSHYGGLTHVPTNNCPPIQVVILHYDAPNNFADGIPQSTFTKPALAKDDDCIICYEKLSKSTIVGLNVCDHVFHRDCIHHALKVMKPQCPVCRKTVGIVQGKSPSGTMEVRFSSIRCSGFMDSSIIIHYVMKDGIQKSYHENPGQHHSGKNATAYLPDNTEGRQLLKRLKYAFLHGLTFTVGTSATTGCHNQCTWSTIHHKTSATGGVQSHGFPDPCYFFNCNEELDNVKVPKSHFLDDNGVEI